MKIYTKTGDAGETGLFGGGRVAKDHRRVEAYGSIDELNALLGVTRALGPEPDLDRLLVEIQHDLFDIGAALATPEIPEKVRERFPRLRQARVEALEREIDRLQAQVPELQHFILPGGAPLGAHLHHARTVCRRAERRLVRMEHDPAAPLRVDPVILSYVNRLSDLLFVLGRGANARAGVPETTWQGLS
ncbi:MAG: cob(I)yrinic acid a,c-diamide adenosyltransferase [Nevskia sp.]|nr:cob(I)yrinic acid a,c-diamide adenosyltransferase [Nevskia sp.]